MLCRRATLDVIGLTAFGYDFGAVEHVRGGGQGDGAGEGKAPNTDIMGFWTDILAPAMLLAFNLPLPDALVPGYQGFVRGVAKLDLVVDEMLAKHRAGDVAGPQSGRSILGAMLDAQAAGNALVTDKQIRDELQTFLLAGADTTAVTLSFCLWELSRHPAGLARAQAERAAASLELRWSPPRRCAPARANAWPCAAIMASSATCSSPTTARWRWRARRARA